jgi:hypothetical protein
MHTRGVQGDGGGQFNFDIDSSSHHVRVCIVSSCARVYVYKCAGRIAKDNGQGVGNVDVSLRRCTTHRPGWRAGGR